jgi:integrase
VLGAGTGLRQGEAMAVTSDRVDWLRRTLRCDRQVWTPRHAPATFAVPKSPRSTRTVALSDTVLAALSEHVKTYGTGPDGLVFHHGDGFWRRDLLAKQMKATAARAHLDGITWHSLRHHHASVLLSAGVSPALVAERLGHDVGTLMQTYAHVIRSDDDRVRAVVEASFAEAAEDWLRTGDVAENAN